MIGVIDYGAGNLASVHNAFEHLGHAVRRCADPAGLADCERALLPGVGSFRAAMEALHSGGWVEAIRDFAASRCSASVSACSSSSSAARSTGLRPASA
jgi:glutamine amidotransferase